MIVLSREILACTLVMLLAGCGVKKLLDIEAPGGDVALMTGVLITKEGGGYKIQYSLQDDELAYTSADGTLTVTIVDFNDERKVYFQKSYEVEKSDFKKYKTILGGEVWGHVIILKKSAVEQYGSDVHATMKLKFETEDGARFEEEDSVFL